ncbi:MAG TPA: LamG-like jellyroll fold domain-containing protein [Cytophagaceae bacterium]
MNLKLAKKICVILFLTLSSRGMAQTINILSYGAKGDGKTINTISIQKAIDDCSLKGGGMVLFPQGIFVSGTIRLKSNVTIHLSHNSILKGSDRLEDYPDIVQKVPTRIDNIVAATKKAFLYAEDEENIALTGEGTFYPGGDQEVFQDHIDESPNRPYGLRFVNCNYVTVTNIHMRNSAYWMQRYVHCDHLRLSGLKVWNHCNLNNDGIDIDGCHDVTVSDCYVDASDDGICLKSEGNRACEDVVITNCVVSSFASAIKLGTGSLGGFSRVSVSNCIIRPTKSIKMSHTSGYRGGLAGIDIAEVDGGKMNFISFNNILIDSAETPIFIKLGNRNGKASKDDGTLKKSTMRDIFLSNIHAKNANVVSSSITGFPGNYIENVQLSDITIETLGGGTDRDTSTQLPEYSNGYPVNGMFGSNLPAYGIYFRHVKGLMLNNVKITSVAKDQRSAIVFEDVHNISSAEINLESTSDLGLPQMSYKNVTLHDLHKYSQKLTTQSKRKNFKEKTPLLPQKDSALVGFWPFEEGAGITVQDLSKNKNNGNIHGAEWVDGKKGRALSFKGKNYIDFGSPATLNVKGDISVSFWMKLTDPNSNNYYRVFAKRKAWNDPAGFELEISPGNSRLNFSGGNRGMKDQGLVEMKYDEKWHHYTAIIRDGRLRLYLDGKLVGWDENVASPTPVDAPFVIGASSSYGDYFEGVLDEIKIWNRALMPEEIGVDSR